MTYVHPLISAFNRFTSDFTKWKLNRVGLIYTLLRKKLSVSKGSYIRSTTFKSRSWGHYVLKSSQQKELWTWLWVQDNSYINVIIKEGLLYLPTRRDVKTETTIGRVKIIRKGEKDSQRNLVLNWTPVQVVIRWMFSNMSKWPYFFFQSLWNQLWSSWSS